MTQIAPDLHKKIVQYLAMASVQGQDQFNEAVSNLITKNYDPGLFMEEALAEAAQIKSQSVRKLPPQIGTALVPKPAPQPITPPPAQSQPRHAAPPTTRIPDPTPIGKRQEGELIVSLIERVVKTEAGFELVGIDDNGPRVTVYKVREKDNGKNRLLRADAIDDLGDTLKYRGVVPANCDPSIRVCHGHIAIEVPKLGWSPVYLEQIVPEIKTIPVQYSDPFVIPLGVDQRGEQVSVNLSTPTGAHLSVAGSTGGGKNGVLDTLICGAVIRYRDPKFFQMILVDVQEINFCSYGTAFHPWMWNGYGVLSDAADIDRVFRYPQAEKGDDEDCTKKGELYSEYERRKSTFVRASEKAGYRIDKLEAYNEYAMRSNAEILPHIMVVVDEIVAVNELFPSGQFKRSVAHILKEFRKFGLHFIGATQRPAANHDGAYDQNARSEFGQRIALKCNEDSTSEMALGKGMKQATKLQGNGDSYYLGPGMSEPIRTQIFFTPPEFIAKLSQGISKKHGAKVIEVKAEDLLSSAPTVDDLELIRQRFETLTRTLGRPPKIAEMIEAIWGRGKKNWETAKRLFMEAGCEVA